MNNCSVVFFLTCSYVAGGASIFRSIFVITDCKLQLQCVEEKEESNIERELLFYSLPIALFLYFTLHSLLQHCILSFV